MAFPPYKVRPIAELLPDARNARTHSPEQLAQIAASIREFGFTVPVLCAADGTIIAGHGRVVAAQQVGLAELPTIDLGHLTPTQRRAYAIADNKLALNAGWDLAILEAEVSALQAEGFSVDLTGFSLEELSGLFGSKGGSTDPDDVPETPTHPVSRAGDIWLLGGHRLACGDCTDSTVVAAVLAGAAPHLMVTDPPYGVKYDPAWRKRAGMSKGGGPAVGGIHRRQRRARE